jgi:hypothetical protein
VSTDTVPAALRCPHEDCEEFLRLTWTGSYEFDTRDVGAVDLRDAHAWTWGVGCLAGHVVLLPGPLYCPCPDDADSADCPHDQDGYDHLEEWRAFRAHDWTRLARVVAHLKAEAKP